MEQFKVFQNRQGSWEWRLRSDSGSLKGASIIPCMSKEACLKDIADIKAAPVVVNSGGGYGEE